MTARFATLRHQHRRTGFQRLRHLRHALHLAHQHRAAGGDPSCIGTRIAEGQHHGARLLLQHPVQRRGILVQLPGDEAAADALARAALQRQPVLALGQARSP
ncbi:hypothetical protein [Ramlibacter montanisoli]|uniref:hypothetical protein n=1 Tax=Ramlibacter montanisoli TaxID=2732512 RepID=UPI00209C3756|nr:hypothetical protein [Ramlibacter montanisoli]